MKRFIPTKLFLSLQEASQKNVDMDIQVLENQFEDFVMLLFSGYAALTDKAAYHNMLMYTRVELSSLTEVSGKKYETLSA
jgi:hypothetical protein